MTDKNGSIVGFNKAMLTQSGYTATDLGANTNVASLYADSDARENALRLFTKQGHVDRLETRFKRKDGSVYTVLLSLRSVTVAGEPCIQAVSEDITERIRLETQLLQSQKMEAVGRLAGGVAHDFNNLLTAIISFAGFVRDSFGPNDPRRDDIREVLVAGDRAAGLTAQLLAFSRRQPVQLKVVNLNDCLQAVEKLLRRTVGEHIAFVVSPSSRPAFIKADSNQLDQVLLNLAVNARDAMPNGGTLHMGATVNAMPKGNDADVAPGEYVKLSVRDNGTGMDAATREKIFEPFFTTKDKDRGTGLGLSTCFGIVKQAGGTIVVDSAPQEGTCFTIYFPVCYENAVALATDTRIARDLQGHETVLVVEDETTVRKLVVRSLEEKGYRVLTAEDGAKGLEAFRDKRQDIDLLLTDIVLPKLSGFALGEAALKLKPDLRLLLMSGYTDELVLRDHNLPEDVRIVWKPFTPPKLQSAVRKVLDGDTRSLDRIIVATVPDVDGADQ